MADISKFLASLSAEDASALMAKLFESMPDVASATIRDNAAAQAIARSVVKPTRTVSRGPTWWDNFWSDPGIVSASSAFLKCSNTQAAVMQAMVDALDKASITGTFDRPVGQIVHKVRIVLMDETAKTLSALEGKLEAVSKAASESALTEAVKEALESAKSARALPDSDKTAFNTKVEAARAARAANLSAAGSPPPAPPAPPAPPSAA